MGLSDALHTVVVPANALLYPWPFRIYSFHSLWLYEFQVVILQAYDKYLHAVNILVYLSALGITTKTLQDTESSWQGFDYKWK